MNLSQRSVKSGREKKLGSIDEENGLKNNEDIKTKNFKSSLNLFETTTQQPLKESKSLKLTKQEMGISQPKSYSELFKSIDIKSTTFTQVPVETDSMQITAIKFNVSP